MIAAIVLNIVLHAQMTVPWVGGFVPTAAPAVPNARPIVLEIGKPLVLAPKNPVVIR